MYCVPLERNEYWKKTYRKQYEKILLLSTQIYWFDIVVGIKQITNVEEIQAWKKND